MNRNGTLIALQPHFHCIHLNTLESSQSCTVLYMASSGNQALKMWKHRRPQSSPQLRKNGSLDLSVIEQRREILSWLFEILQSSPRVLSPKVFMNKTACGLSTDELPAAFSPKQTVFLSKITRTGVGRALYQTLKYSKAAFLGAHELGGTTDLLRLLLGLTLPFCLAIMETSKSESILLLLHFCGECCYWGLLHLFPAIFPPVLVKSHQQGIEKSSAFTNLQKTCLVSGFFFLFVLTAPAVERIKPMLNLQQYQNIALNLLGSGPEKFHSVLHFSLSKTRSDLCTAVQY